MTTARRYRPALPSRAPTASDLAERDRFAELTHDSMRAVRASAEAWRNGLAAFITLVTTGVIIQGRTTVSELPVGWRLATTLLVAIGIVAAVVGLWQALVAQAGVPVAITLPDVRQRYGSLQALEVLSAVRDARRLDRARHWVAASILLLLSGVVLTWWAPAAPSSPPAYLLVTHGATTTCGVLRSADGGVLRVDVSGVHDAAAIPLTEVSNMRVVPTCPK